MNEIIKNLFLTNHATANNNEIIKLYNINLIINCAKECNNTNIPENIKCIKFDIIDNPLCDISQYFDIIADIIKENIDKYPIIIHCKYGKSRSASFVIAYLIKYHNIKYDEALLLIKSKRQSICPNYGFIEQLKKYEMKIINYQCDQE